LKNGLIKIDGNNMAKEITLERLAEAIIKTKKEVMYLKTELEKVQSYLREQHKLKKQTKIISYEKSKDN
jgi:hypothetical protein